MIWGVMVRADLTATQARFDSGGKEMALIEFHLGNPSRKGTDISDHLYA